MKEERLGTWAVRPAAPPTRNEHIPPVGPTSVREGCQAKPVVKKTRL